MQREKLQMSSACLLLKEAIAQASPAGKDEVHGEDAQGK